MCSISAHNQRKSSRSVQCINIHRSGRRKYNAFVHKFKEFVEGKRDLAPKRYIFNNRDQKGEAFLSFLTNIPSQARKFGFDHLKNSIICDCIISGKWIENTKAKLRELADLDLNTVIRICKNDEIMKIHAQDRKDLALH